MTPNAAEALAFIGSSVRIATPMAVAAMGAILAEQSGVFALGLEGMMLAGAFAAAAVTHATGSAAAGVLASLAGGMSVAAVVAIVALRFEADQMVTGLAANTLAAGLTSFLLRLLFHGASIRVTLLPAWPIPGLGALSAQPPLTWCALLGVPMLAWFVRRSTAGLHLRACGENPDAAYACGLAPGAIRLSATLAGGALAGLGGAVLVLQQVGTFTDGMTGGRGYLALAAVIVGRWQPVPTMLACLAFGAASALELRVQALGLSLSSYEVEMMPYLLALCVLALAGRSGRMPAALGMPWRKQA